MPRQKSPSPLEITPLLPAKRMPRTVTLRWLSRQLVEAHARARLQGELRLELAALNALAKLHGLNREADAMPMTAGDSLTIYLPDNGRD